MKKIRLSEQVLDEIKKMIREEGFRDGDKFYSENELTKKLEVSRTSVREAIRMLEMEGIVQVWHGKGIFINESIQEGFEPVAEWLRNNENVLYEHFEVRLIIDPKVAACAAQKATEEDLKLMDSVCRDFGASVSSGKIENMIEQDRKFHQLLAKATRNRTLHVLVKTMTQNHNEGWFSSMHIPGRPEKTVQEHRAILDAVTSGDAEKAEKAMKSHIERAFSEIREYQQNH